MDTLRSTIQILELDASLKTILTGLLDNHIWLQHELHEKKISMSRLKSYFGVKSEKHAKVSSNDKETPSSEDESMCTVGRSEKYKSQNFEKVEEDSGPRHSTDFRTVFGIMIGQISSC